MPPKKKNSVCRRKHKSRNTSSLSPTSFPSTAAQLDENGSAKQEVDHFITQLKTSSLSSVDLLSKLTQSNHCKILVRNTVGFSPEYGQKAIECFASVGLHLTFYEQIIHTQLNKIKNGDKIVKEMLETRDGIINALEQQADAYQGMLIRQNGHGYFLLDIVMDSLYQLIFRNLPFSSNWLVECLYAFVPEALKGCSNEESVPIEYSELYQHLLYHAYTLTTLIVCTNRFQYSINQASPNWSVIPATDFPLSTLIWRKSTLFVQKFILSHASLAEFEGDLEAILSLKVGFSPRIQELVYAYSPSEHLRISELYRFNLSVWSADRLNLRLQALACLIMYGHERLLNLSFVEDSLIEAAEKIPQALSTFFKKLQETVSLPSDKDYLAAKSSCYTALSHFATLPACNVLLEEEGSVFLPKALQAEMTLRLEKLGFTLASLPKAAGLHTWVAFLMHHIEGLQTKVERQTLALNDLTAKADQLRKANNEQQSQIENQNHQLLALKQTLNQGQQVNKKHESEIAQLIASLAESQSQIQALQRQHREDREALNGASEALISEQKVSCRLQAEVETLKTVKASLQREIATLKAEPQNSPLQLEIVGKALQVSVNQAGQFESQDGSCINNARRESHFPQQLLSPLKAGEWQRFEMSTDQGTFNYVWPKKLESFEQINAFAYYAKQHDPTCCVLLVGSAANPESRLHTLANDIDLHIYGDLNKLDHLQWNGWVRLLMPGEESKAMATSTDYRHNPRKQLNFQNTLTNASINVVIYHVETTLNDSFEYARYVMAQKPLSHRACAIEIGMPRGPVRLILPNNYQIVSLQKSIEDLTPSELEYLIWDRIKRESTGCNLPQSVDVWQPEAFWSRLSPITGAKAISLFINKRYKMHAGLMHHVLLKHQLWRYLLSPAVRGVVSPDSIKRFEERFNQLVADPTWFSRHPEVNVYRSLLATEIERMLQLSADGQSSNACQWLLNMGSSFVNSKPAAKTGGVNTSPILTASTWQAWLDVSDFPSSVGLEQPFSRR